VRHAGGVDDEAFEQWVLRREQERRRKLGRLRVNTLGPGPQHGSHVAPQAPRLISRWDGFAWVPVAVASDWEAAAAVLHPSGGADDRRDQPTKPAVARTGGLAERKRARLRELLDDQPYRPTRPDDPTTTR